MKKRKKFLRSITLLSYLVLSLTYCSNTVSKCTNIYMPDVQLLYLNNKNPSSEFVTTDPLLVKAGQNNFEFYDGFVNKQTFTNPLKLKVGTNDVSADYNMRELIVDYYTFDKDFIPFDSERIPFDGELRTGYILREDYLFDCLGTSYKPQKATWKRDAITIDFGDFNGQTPSYIRVSIEARWIVRGENINKEGKEYQPGCWSTMCEFVFEI